MSKLSLFHQYKTLVEDGKLNNDPYQKTTIAKLSELSEELSLKKENSFLSRLSNFARREKIEKIRGVYIWGGVGRGKSMLMDLFFANVNIHNKKRTHFHNFMAETHDLIHDIRKNDKINNVPDHAAKLISQKAKLLCFDEMEISDLTNAGLSKPKRTILS